MFAGKSVLVKEQLLIHNSQCIIKKLILFSNCLEFVMDDNVIKIKSYQFALRIIKLYQYLVDEKKEYVLSKQVLRSGTSIGANVAEALAGQTRKDFIAKLSIAQKEAYETNYWLDLLRDSHILEEEWAQDIIQDNQEIIKILIAIIKHTKQNLQNE